MNFLGLSARENQDKTRLTSSSFSDPLQFASLCWWLLSFSLFSRALCISFSHCSSLDIRLLTYAFSYSLPRSSRRILPVLASSLTFLRVFLDSLYVFSFLLSSVALFLCSLVSLKTFSPRTWIITISSRDKALVLPVLLLCELIRNCKILRITVQPCTTSPVWFSAQNAGSKLFGYPASHIPAHVKPPYNA